MTQWTAAHQAPHPWDSPGRNTGVGCHFLLQCMKVKSENEVTQSCPTLATPRTAAYQAPLSMGFSRQECWSEVGGGWERVGLGVWDLQMQTGVYRMDKQQSPTVEHRRLYLVACGSLVVHGVARVGHD